MKVLLIVVNKEKHPYPVVPLGAAYISYALDKNNHNVEVIDLCFIDDYKLMIKQKINSFMPDFIGISMRNIDNTAYPKTNYYLPEIKAVIDECKKATSATIVVGGSGFSVMPEKILEYLDLNYGIVGEGEQSFNELIDALSQPQKQIQDIRGLVYKAEGKIIKNAKSSNSLFFEQNTPTRETIDINEYYRNGSIINVQTKRGCSFQCTYCTYPLIEGSKIKKRNAKDVVEELKFLVEKYKIDYFYFIDSVFNFPMDHALEICKAIIDSKLKIKWAAFFHPRFFNEELVKHLKLAGCSGVELGVDVMSDIMLENLKKNFTVEDIYNANQLLAKYEINQCYYLLLGGPGENRKTLSESFENLAKIAPKAAIVQSGIRIYPNTEIAKTAVEEGYDLSNLLEPNFYISQETRGNLVEIIKKYHSQSPNFIFEGIEDDLSLEVLIELRKAGVKCPLWELKS